MSVCSEKMLNIVPLLGIVLSHVFRTLAIIVPCTIVGYAVPVRGNLFRCLCSDCYNVFPRKELDSFFIRDTGKEPNFSSMLAGKHSLQLALAQTVGTQKRIHQKIEQTLSFEHLGTIVNFRVHGKFGQQLVRYHPQN